MALSILHKETNEGLKSKEKKSGEKRVLEKTNKQKGLGHHNMAMHQPLKKWRKIAETDDRVFFCFISHEFWNRNQALCFRENNHGVSLG